MFAQKLKHGRQNQVEGFSKGQNVVVVEDLISTATVVCWLLKLCALPVNIKWMVEVAIKKRTKTPKHPSCHGR
jgi:adenine/guanine phosphoribosyltransferase-like PRPP-binding protein